MILKLIKRYIAIIIIGIILMFSCNKYDAKIPGYIYINEIKVKTKAGQGASTHNISDLWLYAGGKSLGVFSENQLIPILPDDFSNSTINIVPGIRDNGIKQDIQNYFLYNEIMLEGNILHEGEIDTISLTFDYSEQAEFVFVEGFESGNIFNKDEDGDPDTAIKISEESPRSGNKCGFIKLDSIHNTIEVTTKKDFYTLPKEGNLVYVELDYKSNTSLVVGVSGKDLKGHEFKSDFILLKKQDLWNKIYLNFTKKIKDSGLESYKIYFKSGHNEENETSIIFLDNIKLLYLRR